jgi:hypothetical protein
MGELLALLQYLHRLVIEVMAQGPANLLKVHCISQIILLDQHFHLLTKFLGLPTKHLLTQAHYFLLIMVCFFIFIWQYLHFKEFYINHLSFMAI